uniref:Uncharacterized protein n=1 Tax=Ornithorhynchus anatinus TaxID=9258 RepID=A0A6I8P4U3_ORNAN
MAVVSPEGGGGLPEARPFALAPPAVERGRGCLGGGAGPGVRRRAVPAGPGARGGGGHRPVPRRVGVFRRRGGAGGGAAEDPDGSGAGPGPALPLPARGPAGHEPRLRAPHPQEPAGPVPAAPAPAARPGRGKGSRGSRGLLTSDPAAPRRDDYDKRMKQAATEKGRRRHTPAPARPRKPDRQVYLPRRRAGEPPAPRVPDFEESSGSSDPEPPGPQLFCLEYEADGGEVTSVIVYQDDDPARVSEEVSAHTPLDPPMREALRRRIQEEMAKRQSLQ